MSTTTKAPKAEKAPKKSGSITASALAIKLMLVGAIDALLIWMLVQAWTDQWWPAVVVFVLILIAVNLVYFTRGLPLKYLLPGLIFLLLFQVLTIVLTGYSSFTNYGTGHLGDKSSAIQALVGERPVADSADYPAVPIEQGGDVSMLVTFPEGTATPGETFIGTAESLTPANPADLQRSGERVTGITGYTSLNLGSLSANPDLNQQWTDLRVPLNLETGTYLRATGVSVAKEVRADLVYDPATDTMTNVSTGTVYTPNDLGNFQAEDGTILQPGWQVRVGFDNYVHLFTDEQLRNRFLPITIWTFFFAFMTVFTTFVLGLLFAIIMTDRRMKGQRYYRVLLILPYAMPIFLTAPLWRGMLNTDFGLINQMLPGPTINWLGEATTARLAVLFVNLWIAYPYFFLVCSGALTAIPGDLKEAAFVDGASGWHAFRTVILPLLMISVGPLLIASFTFNFNNYTLIEMLTGGGPFPGQISDGGNTDLLINWTYRIAFNDTNQQLGLAAAVSIVIFIVVGTISAFGLRQTKRLEEIERMTTTQAPPAPPAPPTALKPVRMSPGRWIKTVGWRHLILVMGVLFALFPISYIINLSTSPGSTLTSACPLNLQGAQTIQCILPLPPFDTQNYEAVLNNPQRPFPVWFKNTLIIATVVATFSVFMGASAAFAFSRMRFRGRRAGLTTLILIQMFPSILAITAIFLLLSKIRDTFPTIGLGTIWGLMLIYLGGSFSVNTYLMKGFFDTIPVEIDESARIDGASHVRIFFGMILRLATPVLTVVFFVTFTGMFNELAIAQVVLADQRNTTLAVGLYSYVSNPLRQEWGLFAAGAIMAAIPLLIVFAFAQRSLVTGLTAGAVKG